LPAGTYNWVVKDIISGCEKSGSITITQPTAITASAVKNNDVSCFNGTDGKLTVTASGGTGILTYSINGGTSNQTSNVFSGLTIGTYTVTVKDANNCTKTTNAVTISQPNVIIWSCPTVDASCYNGNDGSVTLTFSGGTAPYTISINGSPFVSQTSPATYNNLAAGNYTKVLKDANGCTKSGTFTIKQPTQIIASAVKNNDVTCNNGNDGKLTVTASGGTGTLTYSLDGVNYQSSNIFEGLTAGTYSVIVKDENNCTAITNSVVINESDVITATDAQTGCEKVTVNNVDYIASGTFTQTLTNAAGCDSTLTINVTILEPTAETISAEG
jgi:hypothetical protein